MAKKVTNIEVKDATVRTIKHEGEDFVCILVLTPSNSRGLEKRQDSMLSQCRHQDGFNITRCLAPCYTVINGNVTGDVISDGGTKNQNNYDTK